jgi:hypothetical protein
MRRVAVAGLCLAGAAALGGAYLAFARGSAGPDGIVVSPNPFDWGEIDLEEFLETRVNPEREVTIENRGSSMVLVRLGMPAFNCVCFQPITSPSASLRPGERTSFRVIMDPTKTDPRPFHKEMYVKTGDARTPQITVPVVGEVIAPFHWDRRRIEFGAVEALKGAPPQRFSVRPGPGWVVEVEDAFPTNEAFDVAVEPATPGFDVVVTPRAGGAAKGRVETQVTVRIESTGKGRPPRTTTRTLYVVADFR